jgi:hypothetical protein
LDLGEISGSHSDRYAGDLSSGILSPIKNKAIPLHAMEALGGRGDIAYRFTTSALDGGE